MYKPQITLNIDEAEENEEYHEVLITIRYTEDGSQNLVAVDAINDIRKAYQDSDISYIHTDHEGTHFVLVKPEFITSLRS